MSKRILIPLTVMLLLVSIVGHGCPAPPRIPRRPEVRSVTHQWGEITSETAEIITTIIVYNPNPFTVPVKRVQTELFVAGIKVAWGETEELEMKTEGEFPINISTIIQVSEFPAMWVEHLKQDEVSEMELVGALVFDLIITEFTFRFPPHRETLRTNILGSLESILRKAEATEIAPFGDDVPFKLVIESISASWGEVTEEMTELKLVTQVFNDSPFPITVSRALAEVTLNEMPLGDGRLAEEYQLLSPDSVTEVEIILALHNELLLAEFMPRIENGERSIFSIKASFVLDLPPEIAEVVGQESVEVLVYEVSGEFETGLLGGMLGGMAR